MRCSSCGSDNPDGARFCDECAAPMPTRCPACGAPNRAGAKFCNACASQLAAPPAHSPERVAPAVSIEPSRAPEGERKTVTALFADLKGSTEMIEHLDPEEARAIIDPALRIMVEAVRRYEGYVVQSTGDGVFALFGAPAAYEDHPQRALYAALQMQRDLREYAQRLADQNKLALEARVGVNTGEVVVRTVEIGGKVEYTPIGLTANLAARLQTVAPPGSVAISEHTRRLAEGYFELRSLGPIAVKGVSDPVSVFEVIGPGPLRTHFQLSARRGLTRFVGRERELEQIERALELALAGHGQIVAIAAEAGAGKSRLVHEFKPVIPLECKALEAYSVSHGKASAWLPVLDLLRGYFGILDADDAENRREKLRTKLNALDPALGDALPYLSGLLGIQEAPDPLAQMDPQIRRRRTLDALRRVLIRESLNQPVVLIFEDLHWIDDETQALLDLLADSVANARVLLLVNYRPEYRHEWANKSYYSQLRLSALDREDAGVMLSALLGDGVELNPVKRMIIERTEGNPFFIEEMTQALFDEGALVRNGGVKVARSLSQIRLPTTVQGILAARIDRLPAAEKELLQTLAVIGRESSLGVIRRMASAEEPRLERMLTALQAGEFVYEQPAFPDPEYVFKHALTQEVAYGSLLSERRRGMHQRIAEAIEAHSAERLEDHYPELAHHYLLTTDYAKAIRYAQAAAQQAADRSAYREASSSLHAALKLLDKLPNDTDRMRVELALHTTEQTIAAIMHGFASDERLCAIDRICELSGKLGETAVQLRGLVNLAQTYFPRGEAFRTVAIAEQCLSLAEGIEDSEVLGAVYLAAAFGAHSCGRLSEGVLHYAAAMSHARRAKRRGFTPIDTLTSSTMQLASVLLLLGRSAECLPLLEEGIRHAREVQDMFAVGMAHAVTSWVHQYLREPEIVRAHGEASIALADEHGFPEWRWWGTFHRGWAIAELGELKKGIAEMEAGIAGFDRIGGVPREQFALAMLAQGYQKLGRSYEALQILNQALAHVERTGEMVDTAEMLRLKAEWLLARDGSSAPGAERLLRTAIDLARSQEARWWELRTSVSLARLLVKHGRREEALAILAEIYDWFTEGFDTADLKDAKALLDQLGG